MTLAPRCSHPIIQGAHPGLGGQPERPHWAHGGRREGRHPLHALLRPLPRRGRAGGHRHQRHRRHSQEYWHNGPTVCTHFNNNEII